MYDTDGDERRFFVVILPVHEVFLLGDSNQDKLKSDQDKPKSDQDKPKSDQDKSKSNIDKPKSNTDKLKSNTDKLKNDIDKSKSNIDNQGRLFENLQKVLLLNYKKDYKMQVLKKMAEILLYCEVAKARVDILGHIGLKKQTKSFKEYMEPMIEMGFLKRTIPEIPSSRNQKYITTIEGNKLVTNE